MHDRMHQKAKHRKKSFDFRRTTKAHEANMKAAKKKINSLREKEAVDNSNIHSKRNSMPAKYKKAVNTRREQLLKGGANQPVKALHN